MTLAAARDDQFLVEQDLHEAAAPMDGLLQDRDHDVPRRAVAVSHHFTIFVLEPRICPLAATKMDRSLSPSVSEFPVPPAVSLLPNDVIHG